EEELGVMISARKDVDADARKPPLPGVAPAGADRAHDDSAAGARDANELANDAGPLGDVLERLERERRRERRIRERERERVGADRSRRNRAIAHLTQAAHGDVHTDSARRPARQHSRRERASERGETHRRARVLLDPYRASRQARQQKTGPGAVTSPGVWSDGREDRRLTPQQPAVRGKADGATVLVERADVELLRRGARAVEEPAHDPVVELALVHALLRAHMRDEIHTGPHHSTLAELARGDERAPAGEEHRAGPLAERAIGRAHVPCSALIAEVAETGEVETAHVDTRVPERERSARRLPAQVRSGKEIGRARALRERREFPARLDEEPPAALDVGVELRFVGREVAHAL